MEVATTMSSTISDAPKQRHEYNSAEMGAIAHLFRAEVYRSTIWRTRLDNTTNWAIVTMGWRCRRRFRAAMPRRFRYFWSGLLLAMFLALEARRYRYFNVWRARARWMEANFYAPDADGRSQVADGNWQALARAGLSDAAPSHPVSFARLGRRLRRSYVWILTIQASRLFRQDRRASNPRHKSERVCASRSHRPDSGMGISRSRRDFTMRAGLHLALSTSGLTGGSTAPGGGGFDGITRDREVMLRGTQIARRPIAAVATFSMGG